MIRWLAPTALALLLTVSGCAPSRPPVSPGEIPSGDLVTHADEQYGQQVLATLMRTYPLERDDYAVNRVRDIVDKLASAAGANNSPWNVYVLRGDNVVNAAATRGNFVFVWTGMLRKIGGDGELSAVLAHELGHVLAGHTQPTPAEEAGQIMADVTGQVTGTVVGGQGPYGALGQVAGVMAQQAVKALIVNPESQRKELEADHIGLFLMADAGFDPRDAVTLWSTLADASGSPDYLSFFRSHPSSQERLEQVEGLLPAAIERYETALAYSSASQGRPRRRQFEPDTFAIGRDPAPVSQGQVWVALEDGTTIFTSPSTTSRPVMRLRRGAPVTVGSRTGAWREVFSPARGYILNVEIYPKRD
jgi:predicted Zn-dependent protease